MFNNLNNNYTIIVNGITGKTIETRLEYFLSLDGFKKFISGKWSVSLDSLLILLSFGNKLDEKAYNDITRNLTSREIIYVFDKRLFSITNPPLELIPDDKKGCADDNTDNEIKMLLSQLTKEQTDSFELPVKPIISPLIDMDFSFFDKQGNNHLKSQRIASIITTNLGWLSALEIDIHYFQSLIKDNLQQIQNIMDSLNVSEHYLQMYCYDFEELYNSNVNYLNQLGKNKIVKTWLEFYENKLSKLYNFNSQPLSKYFVKAELSDITNQIVNLHSKINNNLKTDKSVIDKNISSRLKLTEKIKLLHESYAPDKLKFELEETMLLRFVEMLSEIRSESHEILDTDEDSDLYIKNSLSKISKFKSNYVSKFHTIALALYTQVNSLSNLKYKLQEEVIKLMGQISYIQIEILNLKRHLLKDTGRDLEIYQNCELKLARVEDIPIIYCLFMIETLRRSVWFIQLNIQSATSSRELLSMLKLEKQMRNQWKKSFESRASYLNEELLNISDLVDFDSIFNGSLKLIPSESENMIEKTKILKFKLQEYIESYIVQVKNLNFETDIIETLQHYYNAAMSIDIPKTINTSGEIKPIQSDELLGYKQRIKKLELLLHTTKLTNSDNWPTGFLESNSKYFKNNLPSINSKLCMSSSSLSGNTYELVNHIKYNDLEEELKELKNSMKVAMENNEILQQKCTQLSDEKVDIQLERDACKETLANMNNELSKLTTIESDKQRLILNMEQEFKRHVNDMISTNTQLLKTIDTLEQKYESVQVNYDEANKKLINSEKELEEIKRDFENQSNIFEERVDSLKTQYDQKISELEAKLNENNNEDRVSSDGNVIEKEREIIANAEIKTNDEKINSESLKCLFTVISSNILILENIGLLLSSDENGTLEIRRVKGLKKNNSQSILNEYDSILNKDSSIKSSVLQNIKVLFEDSDFSNSPDIQTKFVDKIKELYEEKLYESSVIKRFEDIELLAKKLTKENKFKKNLLDKFKHEKLTVSNFEIGDLALFLPTKENTLSEELSTASSWNSNFSSVDLSTPPPFETLLQSQSTQVTNKPKDKIINSRPWAAFTAFDETSRYFLKDYESISVNKEWFIGKISGMQKFIAEGPTNNKYRLPKGSVWYEVSATIESSQ